MICARTCFPWTPEADGRDIRLGPLGLPMATGRWVQIAKKVLNLPILRRQLFIICSQGVPVHAEKVFCDTVHHASRESNPASISLDMDLFSYSGDDEPTWAEDKEGEFKMFLWE